MISNSKKPCNNTTNRSTCWKQGHHFPPGEVKKIHLLPSWLSRLHQSTRSKNVLPFGGTCNALVLHGAEGTYSSYQYCTCNTFIYMLILHITYFYQYFMSLQRPGDKYFPPKVSKRMMVSSFWPNFPGTWEQNIFPGPLLCLEVCEACSTISSTNWKTKRLNL